MSKYDLYIKDIELAIKRIETSIHGLTYDEFKIDADYVDAQSMRIQIIGESLKKLPKEVWGDFDIEVKKIIEFRNIISHAYFRVNTKILWDILEKKIPLLKKELRRVKLFLRESSGGTTWS
jgi:uncharacterized protein with HEPN domain